MKFHFLRRLVGLFACSALTSMVFLNYTSNQQIEFFGYVRSAYYFSEGEKVDCSESFNGYGSLYKNGCYLNPVHVAQQGIPYTDTVYSGKILDDEELSEVRDILETLENHAYVKKHRGVTALMLPYEFPWPRYGLKPGWLSGMAQGHAVEIAVAAFLATDKGEYLKLAVKFANAFRVPVEEGGIAVNVDDGVWFEEYAQTGKKPSYALNGHIFALEGLQKLVPYEGGFRETLKDGLRATKSRLPLYDGLFWSKYDLRGTPANQKYHHVHIRQLGWLEVNYGDEIFKEYAEAFVWQQVQPLGALYRIIAYPSRFLVFLFVINFLAVTAFLCSFWAFGEALKKRKVVLK